MSNTIYSREPILTVHERSGKKAAALALDYERKGWVMFFPPLNVVYEKELPVGVRRSFGYVAFMRRKENVGKEAMYCSRSPTSTERIR